MVVSALALAAGLLALASLATPTQAESSTTERVPYSNDYYNVCTGETFHMDGTLLTVGHVTTDENGGQHLQFVENIKGTGENLTTGAEYAFNSKYHGQANYFGGPYTYYVSFVMTMSRQGSTTPDDDWKVTISLKQTINANGELTTEIVNSEFNCN
jgi:hypothetical protein